MIRLEEGGHLGGAVADVFDREPLDPASPVDSSSVSATTLTGIRPATGMT